jgi:hypothetical protein
VLRPIGLPELVRGPEDLTVLSGTDATLTALARGSGTLTYVWKKSGVVIPGATGPTYTYRPVALSDGGSFTVEVSGMGRTFTSTAATVTVVLAPTIAMQPSSVLADVGSEVKLGVAVTGTAPFNYQWRKGGVNIVGASGTISGSGGTGVLTLSNLASADVGSYDVVVTNAQGSATSRVAKVGIRGEMQGAQNAVWSKVSEVAEIVPEGQSAEGGFGYGVGLWGNKLLVQQSAGSGRVHYYDRSRMEVPVRLGVVESPVAGSGSKRFGVSGVLMGTTLALGHPDAGVTLGGDGRVYTYAMSNPAAPVAVATQAGSPVAANQYYGSRMALSGNLLSVSQGGDGVSTKGRQYFYRLGNDGSLMLLSNGVLRSDTRDVVGMDGSTQYVVAYYADVAGGTGGQLEMTMLDASGSDVVLGGKTGMATALSGIVSGGADMGGGAGRRTG